MHTLGKVMIWLVAVLAVAVVILSGRMLEKRGKWIRDIAKVRVENDDLAKKIVERKAELRKLRQDYAQMMLPWDRYATDVGVALGNNPADPSLQVSVTPANLGMPETPEKPVFHLFMPTGSNAYSYVGPFQATAIQDNGTPLKPMWRTRANEMASWKPGNWRVRTAAPTASVDHFRDLQAELTVADELLAAKKKSVVVQDKLIAAAKEHLKSRQEELLGFENPPPNADVLGAEWSKGLVAALELEDTARNGDLAEVDRLRREIRTAFRKEQRLAARNVRLASSLPGAEPAAAEAAPKAQVSSK